MSFLYEYVHEIKKVTGWSQERISIETGLHLSTINRICRLPTHSGNETSKKLITQLHQEVVKSPFPEYIERLFNFYDDWKERLSKKDFSEYLNTLEPLLVNHKSLDTNELVACRACWLMGHIYFDRAFYLKRGEIAQKVESALKWYQQALAVLDSYTDTNLTIQKYKIQQCIVSTQFNTCEPRFRSESEEIRRWLLEMGYLALVEAVVKEDTWNWIAARNGLVAASLLRDFEKCWFFWTAMQSVTKNFANLDFVPATGWVSIREDSDLAWFVEQITRR